MSDHDVLDLGATELQLGMTVPNLRLAYKTYGTLAPDRSNMILYPTSYGAQHTDVEWLIGEGRILDPSRWFIVIPNMFNNGLSTSPSNIPAPLNYGRFPAFTHWDNVLAQKRLVEEVFGVERLAMVYGWSMGGQQALHWGAMFPDQVERICAICTSARTSEHNKVFLEGVRATLTADPAWNGKYFTDRPVTGLRAMGRVYAGWAMSQAFYREKIWAEVGFSSLEDWMIRSWEGNFVRRNGDDLLGMLDTWYYSDISDNPLYQGDLDEALASITARSIVMPSATDLYFTTHDSAVETAKMPNGELREIDSVWGHRAGNPNLNAADEAVLKKAVDDLLSS
jgi:homoserine O-acetyltransferase/O-succinyltransferase